MMILTILKGNERVTKKAITDNDELASEPAAPAVPEIVEVTTRDDEKDEGKPDTH